MHVDAARASPLGWQSYCSDANFIPFRWLQIADFNIRQTMIGAPHPETGKPCRFLAISAPPQHGKLTSDDTQILTSQGFKRHGDLRVGDYVHGLNGRLIRVLAVGKPDYASLEVEFSDGSTVRVHPKHEWLVHEHGGGRGYRVLETEEMLLRGVATKEKRGKNRRKFTVDYPQALEGIPTRLPVDPYVLGLWLGDGKKNAATITHHPDDHAVIDECRLRGIEPTSRQVHATTGIVTTGFGKGQLLRFLRRIGVYDDKHIPDLYQLAATQQRRDLLAGLIDSDGNVSQDGSIRFVNTNVRMVADVERLVRSLGYHVGIQKVKPQTSTSGIVGKKPVFYLRFTCHDGLLPTALKRKKVRGKHIRRRRGIVDIRPVTPSLGRCIQVDSPDGIYLVTKNLVPTHNSVLSSIATPSYAVGRWPRKRGILACHTQSLADEFSRQARNQLRQYGRDVFGVGVNMASQAIKRWRTARYDGGMEAVGISSGVSGRTADWLVFDDPFPGFKQAMSATFRQTAWDYFVNDLMPRLSNYAWVILLQCLTAETPVRMADGSERRIIDIRPGDMIASFEDGKLVAARVAKQRLSGRDSILKLTTTSGKIVRGNARHPFLIETPEGLQWRRLGDLTSANRIVTVRDSGENGKARSVSGRTARTLSSAEDTATSIIKNGSGVPGIAPPLTAWMSTSRESLGIGTGSPWSNSTTCLPSNEGSVLSVKEMGRIPLQKAGEIDHCALITAIQQASFAACYATLATRESVVSTETFESSGELSNTFKLDQIASVEPDGFEDVYDIEVEGTHNFIANGLSSSNTRWNDDDIIGRIRRGMGWNPKEWRFLNMSAISTDDEIDHIGRPFRGAGEALCPKLKSLEFLERQRRAMTPEMWASLYLGVGSKPSGVFWGAEHFDESVVATKWPDDIATLALFMDPAMGKDAKGEDLQALVACGHRLNGDLFYVDARMYHETIETLVDLTVKFIHELKLQTGQYPQMFRIEDVAFQKLLLKPLRDRLKQDGILQYIDLGGWPVPTSWSKDVRIMTGLGPYIVHRLLRFVDNRHTQALIDQLVNFGSAHIKKDGPDALAYVLEVLDEAAELIGA